MTNREDLPETVAVPVELLKRFKLDNHARVLTSAETELVTLIPKPKPKPRLVAFNYEAYESGEKALAAVVRDSADLLTLLDDVADTLPERWTVNYPDRPDTLSSDLKARIRTALGVTE